MFIYDNNNKFKEKRVITKNIDLENKGKDSYINPKFILHATKSPKKKKIEKSKTLQLLFLWMRILLGSCSLGPGISTFRLLSFLGLRDHVFNGQGVLGRSATG